MAGAEEANPFCNRRHGMEVLDLEYREKWTSTADGRIPAAAPDQQVPPGSSYE